MSELRLFLLSAVAFSSMNWSTLQLKLASVSNAILDKGTSTKPNWDIAKKAVSLYKPQYLHQWSLWSLWSHKNKGGNGGGGNSTTFPNGYKIP